jgi:sirohydrochlorin cobaltochelatase
MLGRQFNCRPNMEIRPLATGVHEFSGYNMVGDYSGILLIGHGTKAEQGRGEFLEIVGHMRDLLPRMPVEGAFLEFARPTIAEAIAQMAGQGGKRIAAVPMFLSTFGHTRDDIPRAIAWAVRNLPEMKVQIKRPIGLHKCVVELSAMRFREALEGKKQIPAEDTLLIITAHGSPERTAILELAEFAVRRIKLTPAARAEPCFAILGRPPLADVLKQAVSRSYKRIVVQSHLLLKGRYHDMIRDQVETFSREYPDMDWIVTDPLGPHPLLAQAAVEIVNRK